MTDKEAMIRKRDQARESRTAVNSHFPTYAAAILAFQTSFLVGEDVNEIDWACLYSIGGGAAILSFIVGSIVVLIRLRDARLGARLARYRLDLESQEKIDELSNQLNRVGWWINRLIPTQVIMFIAAAVLFLIWIVGVNWDKLVITTG